MGIVGLTQYDGQQSSQNNSEIRGTSMIFEDTGSTHLRQIGKSRHFHDLRRHGQQSSQTNSEIRGTSMIFEDFDLPIRACTVRRHKVKAP
jgi:hypothetical protein